MNFGGVMMALGAFRFGMANGAYQEFNRSTPHRWSKVNRIGRAPALQYGGPGTEEITISGVIYPAFRGGLRQVDGMRAKASLRAPLMMTDGLGWIWNRWVITNVDEGKSFFLADGAPRKIEFTLKLEAYGGDSTGRLGGLF
ncbi:phage tail protein [Aliiroseovarius lamellibrachiae]|uniref:phage tail protein n=1 Tax=Aliiroseovarius lamellibrachiae TaxID=1924933 RepID=UPI001FE5D3DD|nr:phage tail protein [Aliiroseovarius lamellibrachiae]